MKKNNKSYKEEVDDVLYEKGRTEPPAKINKNYLKGSRTPSLEDSPISFWPHEVRKILEILESDGVCVYDCSRWTSAREVRRRIFETARRMNINLVAEDVGENDTSVVFYKTVIRL